MAETIHPTFARERVVGEAFIDRTREHARAASTGLGLPSPTFLPRRYKPRNVGEWTGHLTFASELIGDLEPGLIVELGTHWGEAYFTFCQTVQERGLSTLCYAVDHWLGDEHAGHYGEEVFEEVGRYNDRFYRQFSYLLRRSFDDALAQFADNTIDLLHIDGLHTYDAVTRDFRNWLPKVSPGGIVLLHDLTPRHQDFGVWRLWDEIKREFPDNFEFHHSWGLGVVRKAGGRRSTLLTELLFDSSPAVREDLRRRYVIYASHLEHMLGRMPAIPAPKIETPSEVRVEVFPTVDGGHSTEVCQVRKMPAGEWTALVFELRDPKMTGPLRVDPGWEPSFVEVGDILVHSMETGELVWSSAQSSPDRSLPLGGTALAHPDDPSFIVNVGDDPNFLLQTPPEVRGPMTLTLNLKVTPVAANAMAIVHDHLQTALTDAAQRRRELAAERNRVEGRLHQTEADLQKARQVMLEMQTSASWRLTTPLRQLKAALRGSEK
ncbi:MAG TPA: class I SAM-dependent methyltransferase [Bryocella sp.]|nr:class I SAM-dependent methyltransferase [Bryocella sp.]